MGDGIRLSRCKNRLKSCFYLLSASYMSSALATVDVQGIIVEGKEKIIKAVAIPFVGFLALVCVIKECFNAFTDSQNYVAHLKKALGALIVGVGIEAVLFKVF